MGSPFWLQPIKKGPHESRYSSTVEEFRLSVISIGEGECFDSLGEGSVEILICIKGEASIRVRDVKKDEGLDVPRGRSVLIPATVPGYLIEGKATLYRAAVPEP